MINLLLPPLLILTAGEPIPPELEKVARTMAAVSSLRVTMQQQKEMSVFGEVLEATGELVLLRPRQLMMDLTGPGGTRLVVNGDTMAIHYKALGKTERFSLSRDPRAKALADHLFLLLEADPKALQGTYAVQITGRKPLQIRLVPKPEALRKVIRHVNVRFDARGFVDHLVLQEGNGDVTRWTFGDPVLNTKIPPHTFTLQP